MKRGQSAHWNKDKNWKGIGEAWERQVGMMARKRGMDVEQLPKFGHADLLVNGWCVDVKSTKRRYQNSAYSIRFQQATSPRWSIEVDFWLVVVRQASPLVFIIPDRELRTDGKPVNFTCSFKYPASSGRNFDCYKDAWYLLERSHT